MTKIVIVVQGGLVQAVFANEPIEYILVDHDNLDIEGEDFDLSPMEADEVVDKLSDIYKMDRDSRGRRIHDILKENNF